ncbi:uncharacterized protein [Oryza sativa Japonica Group]|uniref:Os09g0482740 protein n=3 Tax=Oryza TaxID=4527 RepID=A0A8J8XN19_ORYSJ|nr:uncharacterized protein LOC9271634 [Oryza sativa Japonica Group]KAB8111047.1 hypothetical protein EE612_048584 [Oryza sativa]EEE69930.1 hypothetical protein OsJ_29795 [Oryza sativa Japonica Group]KAF2916744.1 hypothetical protein DAI22_09g142800 [Oryza sativa Japonica Group]BAG88146.1 unnamed protein product [Oryza sativa Japonica Group]BAH94629.1 Os09g0482740 [Oryza sativa Japonica Group]|eukprot:NP_001175901.1 Os09g0482740 [Oryza sativa Japonica Group]
MAMQTGFATSKVLILVGAGLTSSIVLRNGRLSDVLAELQELMKGVNQGEGSSAYDIALLQSQIRNLAQEVRDLTISRPITILSGNSDSGGSLSSYILPAAAVGAMGYCYMWWKGLSLSDVMFVTKRNMTKAVESMSKQLDQVSSALAATKRHLSQRLENLDGKMDEQVEVSKIIRNEVNDVKDDLSQIGFDIAAIQQMVAGLEGKIELLDNKQDATNAGVWYLCQIAGGLKDGINAKFFQEANEKLKLTELAQSERKAVKGLESVLESRKEQKAIDSKQNTTAIIDAEKPVKTVDGPVKSGAVHRCSRISFRKEGLAL